MAFHCCLSRPSEQSQNPLRILHYPGSFLYFHLYKTQFIKLLSHLPYHALPTLNRNLNQLVPIPPAKSHVLQFRITPRPFQWVCFSYYQLSFLELPSPPFSWIFSQTSRAGILTSASMSSPASYLASTINYTCAVHISISSKPGTHWSWIGHWYFSSLSQPSISLQLNCSFVV